MACCCRWWWLGVHASRLVPRAGRPKQQPAARQQLPLLEGSDGAASSARRWRAGATLEAPRSAHKRWAGEGEEEEEAGMPLQHQAWYRLRLPPPLSSFCTGKCTGLRPPPWRPGAERRRHRAAAGQGRCLDRPFVLATYRCISPIFAAQSAATGACPAGGGRAARAGRRREETANDGARGTTHARPWRA